MPFGAGVHIIWHEGGVTMAVPKRKTSKAKTHQRKAANMKKKAPGISICPQCHEPKLPHRVCPNCNYYDGKDIMETEAKLKKTSIKKELLE